MKLRNLIIASLAIAGVLVAASCKKDKADGIDKSQLDGQWMCNLLLRNDGPVYEYPYILWSFNAANNVVDLYQYYSDDYHTTYAFDITDSQVNLKSGSMTRGFEIASLDQKHMILTTNNDGDKYEYRFAKMNAIIIGEWAITWDMGNNDNVTQYYRFDEGGTGARLSEAGKEIADIKWSVEPAKDECFRFVLAIPSSNYENTLAIYAIYNDNQLRGDDEGNYSIYMTRTK